MNKKTFLLFILIFSLLSANSRVSFTRPGAFMRLSNIEQNSANTLFSISAGTEITSVGDILSHSSNFAYNKSYSSGLSWGLSYTMLPYAGINPSEQNNDHGYEMGVHFQNQVYTTGRSNITFGIHDILVDNDLINTNEILFFINFSNSISSDMYTLTSLLGLGTGKKVYDPHIQENTDSLGSLGLYGGFKLNTPFLKQWGGMDFITEVVARSINIGFVFPITREYDFSVGITNFENLSSFSSQSSSNGDAQIYLEILQLYVLD